jgi:hypothetical protein
MVPGRSLEIRHHEHVRYIKTNNPLSAYALHIGKNCLRNRNSLLRCLFIRRLMKLMVVIVKAYKWYEIMQDYVSNTV